MTVRVKMRSKKRIENVISTLPGMSRHLGRVADKIADGAARRGTFEQWDDLETDVGLGKASVFSDDSFLHIDEFGSVNHSPSAPLRSTVDALGLTWLDRN